MFDFKYYYWVGETQKVVSHTFNGNSNYDYIVLEKNKTYKLDIKKVIFLRTLHKSHYNGKHEYRDLSKLNLARTDFIGVTNMEYNTYYKDIDSMAVGTVRFCFDLHEENHSMSNFKDIDESYQIVYNENNKLHNIDISSKILDIDNIIPLDEWRNSQINKLI